MRRVARGFADRGVSVVTFNFPYTEEGRRLPDPGPVLERRFAAVWAEVVSAGMLEPCPPAAFLAGGKSMGGRMASHVAAVSGFQPAPAGLVFFGYPLHPPQKPEQRRDRHLPRVRGPMLFLHGTRDPFGTPAEMLALVATLPTAHLELVDGGDHSLAGPKKTDAGGQLLERALDRAAAFVIDLGRRAVQGRDLPT